MRNIITFSLGAVVVLGVTGLLINHRLDTAPAVQTIASIRWFEEDPINEACGELSSQQVSTCHSFEEFAIGAATIALESGTTLTLDGNHFRFDAGRVVIAGDATFTVRDIAVSTHGVVTLVHYSWLNKLDIRVISGSADIRQGEYSSTVTAGNAVAIDTLPPYDAIPPTLFDLNAANVKQFYDWVLL